MTCTMFSFDFQTGSQSLFLGNENYPVWLVGDGFLLCDHVTILLLYRKHACFVY